jgi:hypothetical protein
MRYHILHDFLVDSLLFLKGKHQPTVEKVTSTLDEASIGLSFCDIGNDQTFSQGSGTARNDNNGVTLLHHVSTEQFMHCFGNEFFRSFQGIDPDRMHTQHDTRRLATGNQVGTKHQRRNTRATDINHI